MGIIWLLKFGFLNRVCSRAGLNIFDFGSSLPPKWIRQQFASKWIFSAHVSVLKRELRGLVIGGSVELQIIVLLVHRQQLAPWVMLNTSWWVNCFYWCADQKSQLACLIMTSYQPALCGPGTVEAGRRAGPLGTSKILSVNNGDWNGSGGVATVTLFSLHYEHLSV